MENNEIMQEFWQQFNDGKEMVLSTAKDNDVTSRTVSTVAYQEKVYFVTSMGSTKYNQMLANPNVSLCLFELYMKGVAKDAGKLNAPENKGASDLIYMVYTEDMERFSHAPDITLIEITLKFGGFGRMKTGGMYVIDFENNVAKELSF